MNSHDWTFETLSAAHRRGDALKYMLFWGHTPPKSGAIGPHVLSQWYPAPFVVGGDTYPTAEHWMMAGKAELFGDDDAFARVLAAQTPGEAKKIGRQVQSFDEETWDAHCLDIVTEGSVHKFSSTPKLRSFLLGTADRILVEASPPDRIWGIGLSRDDPRARIPTQWRGENRLGFALMRARTELARS